MLYYILIALVILSSATALVIALIPSYKVFDQIYHYNGKGGFDYQNCKLDGSCWVKPSNNPEVVPIMNSKYKLPMARMGWNSIQIQNEMKGVEMPELFFNNRYGSN